MAITKPFDEYPELYEEWFSTYKAVYDTEVEALREATPEENVSAGLEIGAGSGLFASRLGIHYGVEPSETMLELARRRGMEMKKGVAEALPYPDESFDLTLMVTAICFLDDLDRAIDEVKRVLKPAGVALFGFVDRDSPLGQVYLELKEENVFYKPATFRSASEVIGALESHHFEVEIVQQTVFGDLDDIKEIQSVREGHGEGGFVVIRAKKPAVPESVG